MRWGVRDEMTNEHMTTALCMNELSVIKGKFWPYNNENKNKHEFIKKMLNIRNLISGF